MRTVQLLTITVVMFSCLPMFEAVGQSAALDVCNTLARSQLTDSSSVIEKRNIAQSQFDLFCRSSGSKKERFKESSSSFKGSFSKAASSLGIGGGKAGSEAFSEENYEEVCNIGISEFVSNYEQSITTNVGSELAKSVTECVNNIAGSPQDITYGTVEITGGGKYIIATIRRKAPNTAPKLAFIGTSPSELFTDCKNGNKSAINVELRNSITVSCTVADISLPVQKGAFVFKSDEPGKDDGEQSFVKFRVVKEVFVERDTILSEISAKFRGAVMAFHSVNCPVGWEEYKPAYGRFIRGIDKSGTKIDPSGERLPGDPQSDAYRSHQHGHSRLDIAVNDGSNNFNAHLGYSGKKYQKKQTDNAGGEETRPVNVALLYCVKAP